MKFFKNFFLVTVGVILSAFCLGAVDDLQDVFIDLFIEDIVLPTLELVEVHPKDDTYLPEYIVVKAKGDYGGKITVVGLGSGKYSKSFDLILMSGDSMVITDNDTYLSNYIDLILVDSISLTDSGEDLIVQDSSGKVLDSIKYLSAKNNESLYFNDKVENNIRSLDKIGLPTINVDSSLFSVSTIYQSGSFLFSDLINPTSLTFPFGFSREFGENIITGSNILPIPTNYQGQVNANLMFNNNILITNSYYLDSTLIANPPPPSDTNSGDNNQNIFTGDNFTGDSNFSTGIDDNNIFTGNDILSGTIPTGVLQISEINSIDGIFPEYVEIVANGNYSGNITIQGLGIGQGEKSVFTNMITGQYLVITDSDFPNNLIYRPLLQSSISLSNDGEVLSLVGQDGQVMDIVNYSLSKLNMANYYTYSSLGVRYFDTVLDNTPSYDQGLLSLINSSKSDININKCGFEIQNTSPIYSNSSLNLISTLNGTKLENSSGKECLWSLGEEILTSCNPSYYKFTSPGIYNGTLEISENGKLLCASNFHINIPLSITSPTCKEDYYKDLYTTWKEKYYEKNDTSNIEETITDLEIFSGSNFTGDLIIKTVLPNPVGADKDNEFIMINNNLESIIDGNNYKFVYGKRSYNLSGYVFYPGENNFTGDFQFYNSDSCINLFSGTTIINNFCYKTAKEGALLESSTQIPITNSPILNIKLKLYDDKSCVMLDGQEHSCIDLKFTKTISTEMKSSIKDLNKEIKTLNSDIKKKLKEIEKKDKTINKITLSKEKSESKLILKYEKLKISTDKKITSLKEKLEKKTQQYKDAQARYTKRRKSKEDELKLTKAKAKVKYDSLKAKNEKVSMLSTYELNYNKTIMSNLKSNWYVVYKESEIDKYEKVYKKYKPLVNSGFNNISYLTMSIKTTDFKKLLDKEMGKIGLLEIYNYNFNRIYKSKIYKNIIKKLNQLKKN